jgi:hypothetical protein
MRTAAGAYGQRFALVHAVEHNHFPQDIVRNLPRNLVRDIEATVDSAGAPRAVAEKYKQGESIIAPAKMYSMSRASFLAIVKPERPAQMIPRN